MVMFFTEDDLISFGTYMVSDLRKVHILTELEDDSLDSVQNRLKKLKESDMANWAKTMNKSKE